MHESYERILKALNLEKHLTTRQIARLLYPTENQKTVYWRVNKSLRYLREKGLSKSKAYGLGKEDFWSLRSHPIVKEMGFTPPRAEVHTFKYEHERDCAEVFVTFALSGTLWGWKEHTRISKGIIPDRTAEFEDSVLHIEVERGDRDRVSEKLKNYQTYFRETGEKFKVLFLVQQMREWEASPHYRFELFPNFITNSVPNGENSLES